MNSILFALALTLAAQADIGPKPTAFFDWPNHAGVNLNSVRLLQCKDAACKDVSELQQIGPQRFSCCDAGCFAMAYGFSAYSQLSATIEGKELKSQPFATSRAESYFEVASGKGKLQVKVVKSMTEGTKNALQYCK